jgi:hypothetical protein
MAKLIYPMLTSLDGYTEDERGQFGWGAPEDEAVHSYINELQPAFGTWLYGRRMYQTMVFWEKSRGDKTAIELFLGGVAGWEAGLRRRRDDAKPTPT